MTKRKLIGGALCLLAIVLPLADKYIPRPGPLKPDRPVIDTPASIADPLKAGFVGDKQEAGDWSGLLYGLARTIEMDRDHPKGPRLQTMLDVANLRDWMVACPPKALAKGDVIGSAVGPELAKLGTSDERLDEADRRSKVVAIFTQAAQTLEDLSK